MTDELKVTGTVKLETEDRECRKRLLSEMALSELEKELTTDAVKELKVLHKQLKDAEKVVRNIKREIDDYLEELDN